MFRYHKLFWHLFFLAIASFLIWEQGAYAKDIAKKVRINEARELVYEANGPVGYKNYYDYDGSMSKPFITFDLIGGGEAGSAGFFSVNPWTGDVWALWGCKKLTTPRLRKFQAKIRQRFDADELKHYKELRSLKPMCISDDN